MKRFIEWLGVFPHLLLGAGLFVIGFLAMNHIVDNWWPFDVGRLDLVRSTALNRADAASLLQAANAEIIVAFLAAVLVTITGVMLPLAHVLNKRFGPILTGQQDPSAPPRFLVTLRQSMWVGVWVTFCIWLQMNRALGPAVAILVAVVLAMFEMLLQIRTRATNIRRS
jgi:hypothetical protein